MGGADLSHLDFALVEREPGRGSMALTHCFGRPENILMVRTGDQVDRYLLPAVRGKRRGALAMTESDAGSNVRGMNCTARQVGGDWPINGTKHFISGAEHADFVIVIVASGSMTRPTGRRSASPVFRWIKARRGARFAGGIIRGRTGVIPIRSSNSAATACPMPRCRAQ